jgi:hypothetical protein
VCLAGLCSAAGKRAPRRPSCKAACLECAPRRPVRHTWNSHCLCRHVEPSETPLMVAPRIDDSTQSRWPGHPEIGRGPWASDRRGGAQRQPRRALPRGHLDDARAFQGQHRATRRCGLNAATNPTKHAARMCRAWRSFVRASRFDAVLRVDSSVAGKREAGTKLRSSLA